MSQEHLAITDRRERLDAEEEGVQELSGRAFPTEPGTSHGGAAKTTFTDR
jgi:hypothetical protein